MKSVLLIGLGRFGRHIAMKLDELHHQVMAVDKEEQRVEAVLPFVTNAQIVSAKMFNLCIAFTYLLCYNKKAIQTKLKFVTDLSITCLLNLQQKIYVCLQR